METNEAMHEKGETTDKEIMDGGDEDSMGEGRFDADYHDKALSETLNTNVDRRHDAVEYRTIDHDHNYLERYPNNFNLPTETDETL